MPSTLSSPPLAISQLLSKFPGAVALKSATAPGNLPFFSYGWLARGGEGGSGCSWNLLKHNWPTPEIKYNQTRQQLVRDFEQFARSPRMRLQCKKVRYKKGTTSFLGQIKLESISTTICSPRKLFRRGQNITRRNLPPTVQKY